MNVKNATVVVLITVLILMAVTIANVQPAILATITVSTALVCIYILLIFRFELFKPSLYYRYCKIN